MCGGSHRPVVAVRGWEAWSSRHLARLEVGVVVFGGGLGLLTSGDARAAGGRVVVPGR